MELELTAEQQEWIDGLADILKEDDITISWGIRDLGRYGEVPYFDFHYELPHDGQDGTITIWFSDLEHNRSLYHSLRSSAEGADTQTEEVHKLLFKKIGDYMYDRSFPYEEVKEYPQDLMIL